MLARHRPLLPNQTVQYGEWASHSPPAHLPHPRLPLRRAPLQGGFTLGLGRGEFGAEIGHLGISPAHTLSLNAAIIQTKHCIQSLLYWGCREILAQVHLPISQDVRRNRRTDNIVGTSRSPYCVLRRCDSVLNHEYILRGLISADLCGT
jgi:hypothetical protein